MNSVLSQEHEIEGKCNQPRPGFELGLSIPFSTTITVTVGPGVKYHEFPYGKSCTSGLPVRMKLSNNCLLIQLAKQFTKWAIWNIRLYRQLRIYGRVVGSIYLFIYFSPSSPPLSLYTYMRTCMYMRVCANEWVHTRECVLILVYSIGAGASVYPIKELLELKWNNEDKKRDLIPQWKVWP